MNKIKPYLFYIIAGVVLLLFIILTVTVKPTLSESGAQNLTPSSSKDRADSQFKMKLERDLLRRARATNAQDGGKVPPTALSPENKEDIDALLSGYIIDSDWEAEANRIAQAYEQQVSVIRQELVSRSELFDQRVSPTSDRGQWYQAYDAEARSLVQKGLDAGLLAMRTEQGSEIDPLADRNVRDLLGLTTQTDPLPTPTQHPQIRERLRVSQVLVNALVGAQARSLPNSNLVNEDGDQRVPTMDAPGGVRVVSWAWGGSRSRVAADAESPVPDAAVHTIQLQLEGTLSALLSAMSQVDKVTSPALVRLGASWDASAVRSSSTEDGAPADELVQLTTRIVVMDFRPLLDRIAAEQADQQGEVAQ